MDSLLRAAGAKPFVIGATVLALVGVLALTFMTRLGIGTSPDSVHYIKAARQLVQHAGNGLPDGDGEAILVQHAPLYSLLLAGGMVAGIDPLDGARWLNALLFGANIFLVAYLVRRSTVYASWLWVVGALLMFAAPVLVTHTTALSEPVFLLLTLLGFWFLARYLQQPEPHFLVSSALSMGLAFLARYAGAAGILTAAAAVLVFSTDRLTRRVRDIVLYGCVASAPLLAWMLKNLSAGSSATGREVFFHPIDRSSVWQALYTVSGWLLIPPSAPNAVRFLVWLTVAAAAIAIVVRLAARDALPPLIKILILFGAVYGGFLALSISFLDANTPLDDRILLPVFAAGLIVLLFLFDQTWPSISARRPRAALAAAGVVVFAAIHLAHSAQIMIASYEQGWGFSSLEWKRSATLAQVRALPTGMPIYSNAPEIVYLHTGRAARPIPRKWQPMNRRDNPDFAAQLVTLKQELGSGSGVVVYFHRLATTKSLPTEEELTRQLSLQVRVEEADGTILEAVPSLQ